MLHRTGDVQFLLARQIVVIVGTRRDLTRVRAEVIIDAQMIVRRDRRRFAPFERTLPLLERTVDMNRTVIDAVVEEMAMAHDQTMTVGLTFTQRSVPMFNREARRTSQNEVSLKQRSLRADREEGFDLGTDSSTRINSIFHGRRNPSTHAELCLTGGHV